MERRIGREKASPAKSEAKKREHGLISAAQSPGVRTDDRVTELTRPPAFIALAGHFHHVSGAPEKQHPRDGQLRGPDRVKTRVCLQILDDGLPPVARAAPLSKVALVVHWNTPVSTRLFPIPPSALKIDPKRARIAGLRLGLHAGRIVEGLRPR